MKEPCRAINEFMFFSRSDGAWRLAARRAGRLLGVVQTVGTVGRGGRAAESTAPPPPPPRSVHSPSLPSPRRGRWERVGEGTGGVLWTFGKAHRSVVMEETGSGCMYEMKEMKIVSETGLNHT